MNLQKVFLLLMFLLVFLSVYLGLHAVVYFSAVSLFGIPAGTERAALAILLALLALAFILAFTLSRTHSTLPVRVLYIVTATWTGLGLNLVLAFASVFVITRLAGLFSFHPDLRLCGAAAVTMALGGTGWGIWNALHPRIREIEVQIRNLPENWRGKKIVQLSDIHYGFIFGPGFIEDLAERVNTQKPEAVVITGDLFDGVAVDFDLAMPPLDRIKTRHGVFFATGNHDTYAGVDRVMTALAKSQVQVLRDSVADLDGLQILGIDYPPHHGSRDLGKAIAGVIGFDSTRPSILLWHAPVQIEAARKAGISLLLSGHTHAGQMFPFGYLTRLIYRGYDKGLHRQGDFSIYISPGTGGWGPPLRTGSTPEITVIKLR